MQYSIRVNDEQGRFRKIFETEELHTAVGIYCKYIIDNQQKIFEITLFVYGHPIMMNVRSNHIFNGTILNPIPSELKNLN